MIVIDANLLLYAHTPGATSHDVARRWLEQTLSDRELVGIPWTSISAFLRIVTHPQLPARASMQEAVAVVEEWLSRPQVRILSPGDRHWALLRRMPIEGQVRGALTSDAQLAALTLEYGGVLFTTDRDFGRFPGLRWVNPLFAAE